MAQVHNTSVTPEAFVRAWQTSSCGAEVAQALDISKKQVYERARRFRDLGVNLKLMVRGTPHPRGTKVDVAGLNAMILGLAGTV